MLRILLLPLLALAPLAAEPLVFGDYNFELRRPDGHVDQELMIQRLKDLGANTYFWLIWHKATDWDDLQTFLPLAKEAGIDVWVYLVPHSETPVGNPRWPYSEPFKLDYIRWAEEIAKLSLRHDNLPGYVMDDFFDNTREDRLSPAYTAKMVAAGKAINPALKFYPLMYYHQLHDVFTDRFAAIVDGVVAAYPRDAATIERALLVLNDQLVTTPHLLIDYPAATPSQPGHRGFVSQTAKVTDPAAQVSFRYLDTFDGPTEGYHFYELRVDDQVIWSEDVAGKDDQRVTVELGAAVAGKQNVTLSLGVFDRRGVGQFPLRARFYDLELTGLELAEPDLSREGWDAETAGAFRLERKAGRRGQGAFQLPLIVMTAGQRHEYEHRHKVPATPELLAKQVTLALSFAGRPGFAGVVTYCLNKQPGNPDLPAIAAAYQAWLATQDD